MRTSCAKCPPRPKSLSECEFDGARRLAHLGCPIAVLGRATAYHGGEFAFEGRKAAAPDCRVLSRHSVEHGLTFLTGFGVDVIDVDPRNGGADTFVRLRHLLGEVLATVQTPGEGFHIYVRSTGHPSISVGGIDYLAKGRMAYLPGTRRPKYEGKGYAWLDGPHAWTEAPTTAFPEALDRQRHDRQSKCERPLDHALKSGGSRNLAVYGSGGLLSLSYATVARARPGSRNRTLYAASRAFTKAVGTDHEALARVREVLTDACRANGLLKDSGIKAVMATIDSGIAGGLSERAK